MRKAKTTYRHPKLKAASSYQKLLVTRVEEMKLLGANLELKEYSGRPPAWSQEDGGYTGTDLKKLRATLVVVKAPGRDGKVLASTYVCNEFYLGTVKISDREGTDTITDCVDSLLEHVTAYVEARKPKRKST